MSQAAPNVEELFLAALELDGSEDRAAFLDRHCGDEELRRQVEELLTLDPQANDFLEAPASMPTVTIDLDSRPGVEEPSSIIGPYRLLEAIAEGGMGVVYVAEQQIPVRRRVALKLIKPGMDSKAVIVRFQAERQALALMDHPNIATILDAGTTESGRPYFVMELVRGITITEFCDREQLTIPERLELFALVCRAVQHAHQKGIIHRDIKPSNVLVTRHDGVPVPKVIDFGVAKAMGQTLTDKTLYTCFNQFVGTPLYMSPEQAGLSGLDVDTRSDIYSLGVLLYELLTGSTPFDADMLKQAAFDEVRRMIREQEPPKPSTRVSTSGAALASVSANRKSDPRRLNRSIRGDLDWIVMKAMDKDRRRRYDTANDLEADVRRFLTDQPVTAGSPSAWYRLGKFARRNGASLGTAAVVAAALVAGMGVSVWQAWRARQAASELRARADETQAVLGFLTGDLFGADGAQNRRRTMTVGELLSQAEMSIPKRFAGQPLVEASCHLALSHSYMSLLKYDEARPHIERAIALRARHLGPEHPLTLEARALLVFHSDFMLPRETERHEAVERLAREVYGARLRVLGPGHVDTLSSLSALGETLERIGRNAEGRALLDLAYPAQLRLLGPDHPETLRTLQVLAKLALKSGDLLRAEASMRQVLEARMRRGGRTDRMTNWASETLGEVLEAQGRHAEAVAVWLDGAESDMRLRDEVESMCLNNLLRLTRCVNDPTLTRDVHQRVLQAILALPAQPDASEGSRRIARLTEVLIGLLTLPPEVPFDSALAVQAAEQAIACDPSHPTAWRVLAVLYGLQGRDFDSRQALDVWERLMLERNARDPGDDPDDRRSLSVGLASGALSLLTQPEPPQFNHDVVVRLAERAVELDGTWDDAWCALAAVCLWAGQTDKAMEAVQTSMTRQEWEGGDGSDWLILALIAARRGQLDEAREWYDRGVKWYDEHDNDWQHYFEPIRAEAATLLGVEPSGTTTHPTRGRTGPPQ